MADVNPQLGPVETDKLHEKMRNIACIVCTGESKGKKAVEKFCTGFCVGSEDNWSYIMTASCRVQFAETITVRGFKDDAFIQAEKYDTRVGNGLAILPVRKVYGYGIYDCGIFGNDTLLAPGEDVYGISHPGPMSFTLLIGKLVSTLKRKNEIDIKVDGFGKSFDKIQYDLQLLQIHGFTSVFVSYKELQSLGAPVFDSKGHIMGMLIAADRGHDYAIPATTLQQFWEEVRKPKSSKAKRGEGTSRKTSR